MSAPRSGSAAARLQRWGGQLALLLMLLFSAGCADLIASQTQQVDPGDTSLQALLDPDALAIPGTKPDDVIAALGEPVELSTGKPPERWQGGQMSTLRYDGIEVVVIQLQDPARSFITEMTITGRDYATGLPVGVGSDRDEIEGALGEAAETEGDVSMYRLSERGARSYVTYEGGEATQMRFVYK